jgi:hypothetical protein
MKTLKFKTLNEFSSQINSFEKVELADCIIEAIGRGLKNNNKKVSVCDVEIEEEQEIFRLYSSNEDWLIALKSCMNTYIKFEEYEKCIKIQELEKEFEIKKLMDEVNDQAGSKRLKK